MEMEIIKDQMSKKSHIFRVNKGYIKLLSNMSIILIDTCVTIMLWGRQMTLGGLRTSHI